MFCKATVDGTPVFVELTGAQLYGSPDTEVTVVYENGGEIFLFDISVGSLKDLQPE